MKGLLNVIKAIVTVYVAITGIFGFIAYVVSSMIKSVPFTGKTKELLDNYGKEIKAGTLGVVFGWPILLFKFVKATLGFKKDWMACMADENIKKDLKDVCDRLDEAWDDILNGDKKSDKKEEKEDSKDEETDDLIKDATEDLDW